MLTLPPSVRIYLARGATDIRKGIDGLCAVARDIVGEDPFTGHLFAFANRRRDAVKILVWDRSGFWLFYKRLERGTFQWEGERCTAGRCVHATSTRSSRASKCSTA